MFGADGQVLCDTSTFWQSEEDTGGERKALTFGVASVRKDVLRMRPPSSAPLNVSHTIWAPFGSLPVLVSEVISLP